MMLPPPDALTIDVAGHGVRAVVYRATRARWSRFVLLPEDGATDLAVLLAGIAQGAQAALMDNDNGRGWPAFDPAPAGDCMLSTVIDCGDAPGVQVTVNGEWRDGRLAGFQLQLNVDTCGWLDHARAERLAHGLAVAARLVSKELRGL